MVEVTREGGKENRRYEKKQGKRVEEGKEDSGGNKGMGGIGEKEDRR